MGEDLGYKERIELLKNSIYEAAQTYKEKLAGKYYLYVFESQCFEMYFGTDNFKHLTGVASKLSPNQFYQLAKERKLEAGQLYFNDRYPLTTSLKKTKGLIHLDDFTSEGYFVIKDLETATETYPYAITDINRSLLIGLKEECDTGIYIPKSFRVKGDIFKKAESPQMFEIDGIFAKTDIEGKYDQMLYGDKRCAEHFPLEIESKIELRISENKEKAAVR